MKHNTLISVRSNCNFLLNYQTGQLHPQAEVILITTAPKYVIDNKKEEIKKEAEVQEHRFLSGIEGINQLIGELQLVVKNMTTFDQMAGSLNVIIKSHKQDETNGKENL